MSSSRSFATRSIIRILRVEGWLHVSLESCLRTLLRSRKHLTRVARHCTWHRLPVPHVRPPRLSQCQPSSCFCVIVAVILCSQRALLVSRNAVVTEVEAWGIPLTSLPVLAAASEPPEAPVGLDQVSQRRETAAGGGGDEPGAEARHAGDKGGEDGGPRLELWSPVPGSSVERALVLFEAGGVRGGKVSVVMDGEEALMVDAAAPPPMVLDRDRCRADCAPLQRLALTLQARLFPCRCQSVQQYPCRARFTFLGLSVSLALPFSLALIHPHLAQYTCNYCTYARMNFILARILRVHVRAHTRFCLLERMHIANRRSDGVFRRAFTRLAQRSPLRDPPPPRPSHVCSSLTLTGQSPALTPCPGGRLWSPAGSSTRGASLGTRCSCRSSTPT